MTRNIREWQREWKICLWDTYVVCCGKRPASFSCISLWMGVSVRDIPTTCWDWHLFPLLLFVVCQHGSMPIPNTKWKKRGNIDIYTGEGFQDVIVIPGCKFFESFNWRIISEVFSSRIWYEWSDYCVSKADSNDTVTERVQKESDNGSWQQKCCWLCTGAKCTELNSSLQQ